MRPISWRVNVGEAHIEFSRRVETTGHVTPIPHVPDGLEKLRLAVLVLQIIRVLPRVEHEQRDASLSDLGFEIVDLHNNQASAHGLPGEGAPAGPHHGVGGLGELALELFETTEVAVDRSGEVPVRPAS